MRQIYYFCFNYRGVPFPSSASQRSPEQVGLRAVAFCGGTWQCRHKRAPTMHSALTRCTLPFKERYMKIEHLGIAVKNLGLSEDVFSRLLGKAPYKQETVVREGVTTSFYETGDSKIELLEASREDSPIAKFIEKRGEGIHHIAFSVEDISAEIERLKASGFIFISEEPKEGADNKLVVFLHPKSTNGVLVELCQEKP